MAGAGMGWGELASAIGGGFNTVVGAYQFIKSDQDRKKYEGMEIPTYKETPEMRVSRMRANQMAMRGFTPAQNAVFFQNLARLSNQNYNRATEVGGGGLANAVSAGIGYNKLGTLNQYAGQDADLLRRNIEYADSFAKNLQAMSNMNTQNDYARYVDMGKAITAERNAAISNIASGVSGGQVTSMGNNTPDNTPNPVQSEPQTVDYNLKNSGSSNDNPLGYDPNTVAYNQVPGQGYDPYQYNYNKEKSDYNNIA